MDSRFSYFFPSYHSLQSEINEKYLPVLTAIDERQIKQDRAVMQRLYGRIMNWLYEIRLKDNDGS